ncbi:ATP-binding cassette domain-containing protein [Gorillibacterium sp. CAU 1737]|uniref:ATP-binding cassette domain-containing protein n=1 Tax=Gorillibacterium sp. CAU 1737 TaxID=3140362 RepID=UPI003260FE55
MDLILDRLTVHREQPILDLSERELRLSAGTITLVLGACGAGKSTLLQAVAGLIPLSSGYVRLEPEHPENVRLASGYLGAQPEQQLFADSVREELYYGLSNRRGRRRKQQAAASTDVSIKQALRRAGLPEDEAFLKRSPFSLSGGQKRRLTLAASLLLEPDWLLLDEPSSGLDEEGKESLQEVLLQSRSTQKGGVLLASHDAGFFLPLVDRVIVLNSGKVAFDGHPQALWNDPSPILAAGLQLPPALMLSTQLKERKIAEPLIGEPLKETAKRMAASLRVQSEKRNPPCTLTPTAWQPDPIPDFLDEKNPSEGMIHRQEPDVPRRLTKRFDPRAVWLFSLLLGVGVWMQNDWPGLLAGLAVTCGVLFFFQVQLRPLLRLSRYYAGLVVITAFFAGLSWKGGGLPLVPGGLGFSYTDALSSLRSMFRLFLVLWLGLLFPLTHSSLELKQVLTETLRPLRRLRFPVEAFSLVIMLLFRYLVILSEEWRKFARIAKIRRLGREGKDKRLSPRDLRPLLLPFFLSILQMGEKTAFALEARGYTGQDIPASKPLYRLTPRDGWLLLGGFLLTSLFFIYR